MDDQEIVEILKKLAPRTAPSDLDGKVLSKAETAAQERKVPDKLFPGFIWLGAAAILLVSVILFLTLEAEKEVPAPEDRTAVANPPSREALAARARLLELKLARLKRLAAVIDLGGRYSDDLGGLDRKLRDIDRIFLSIEPEQKFIRRPFKTPKGGKGNEEGFNHRRLPVDPDTPALRSAERRC